METHRAHFPLMTEVTMIAKGGELISHPAHEGRLGLQLQALRAEAGLLRLPPSLERMSSLLSTVPVDLRSLGEAIKEAPGVAAEAVKLCNSSLFALSQPVASLEQAVIIMDADIVRVLLLTCWLIQHTGSSVPTSENRLFWRHSLLVAQLSRHICEWASYAQPEWAFLAGLFHDIGMLPFLTMSSQNGAARHAGLLGDLGDSVESQRRRFGTDHCELGLQIGSVLGLPLPLVEASARHHQRGAVLSSMPLLSFVGAAELIAGGGEKHDAPLPAGQIIRNALAEYLPGLNHAARLGLVKTLESDMNPAALKAEVMPGEVWDDSLARSEIHSGAGRGRGVNG